MYSKNADDAVRRSPRQSKEKLVLEIQDFAIAGKLVTIRVYQTHNGLPVSQAADIPPLLSANTHEVGRSNSRGSSFAGFYVVAIDEMENEFSLFVSKQKAENLYQAKCAVSSSEMTTAPASVEMLANSILANLDIVGNRQRDIGQLTCRDPEPRLEKKIRTVPVRTMTSKQKNSHLIAKHQDQRAARVRKSMIRAMETIALAHAHTQNIGISEDEDVDVTPRTKLARKSSKAGVLHRIAATDDTKSVWKSTLEPITDEINYASTIMDNKSFSLADSSEGGDVSTYVGMSHPRRVLPERKAKHKELQERRDKGRKHRLLPTHADTSSSSLLNSTSTTSETPTASVVEGDQIGELLTSQPNAIQRNAIHHQSPSSSVVHESIANDYMPATASEQPEREKFLRRRSSTTEQRVLKLNQGFDDIPGMAVELTHERPMRAYSLVNTPPLHEDFRTQLKARHGSLVDNAKGDLLTRPLSRSAPRRLLSPVVDVKSLGAVLNTSVSAPTLPESVLSEPLVQVATTSPLRSSHSDKSLPISSPLHNTQKSPERRQSAGAHQVSHELKDITAFQQIQQEKQSDVGLPSMAGLSLTDHASLIASNRQHMEEQASATANNDEYALSLVDEAEKVMPPNVKEEPSTKYSIKNGVLEIHECEQNDTQDTEVQPLAQDEVNTAVEEQEANKLLILSPAQSCWKEEATEDVNFMLTGIPDFPLNPASRSHEHKHSLDEGSRVDVNHVENSDSGTTNGSNECVIHYDNDPLVYDAAHNNGIKRSVLLGEVSHVINKLATNDREEEKDNDHGHKETLEAQHSNKKQGNDEVDSQQQGEEGKDMNELSMTPRRLSRPRKISVLDMTASSIVATAAAVGTAASKEKKPTKSSKQPLSTTTKTDGTTRRAQAHVTKPNDSIVNTTDSSKSFSKRVSSNDLNSAAVTLPSERRRRSGSSIIGFRTTPASDVMHGQVINSKRRVSIKVKTVQSTTAVESLLATVDTPEQNTSIPELPADKVTRRMSVKPKSLEPTHRKRSSYQAIPLNRSSDYHRNWGKWLNARHVIDKFNCLQLEELVLEDPQNEANLVKLGLRYARWSGTSLAAVLLLEHASVLHEDVPRMHEYWNWMGNAHLDLFLRNRKFLSIASFHLEKCLQAFTRAFAYMESLTDPLFLLRYAICLFWRRGDGNLEKTKDIYHELFSKFAKFCEKDRLHLLFLQFQVLIRLKMFLEAIECMKKIIALNASDTSTSTTSQLSETATSPSSQTPLDSSSAAAKDIGNPPYDSVDYLMMMVHCQQASNDYLQASATFSTILKAKGIHQEGSLSDDRYLDLWYQLAEKCFQLEDYALAEQYYSIAMNFAKDSQVLASIHYNRALCLQSFGEESKCVAEYKRARNVNRHVQPLISLKELRSNYADEFTLLLQKPIRQIIEEVRVNLYDRAVKYLQRLFRRKYRLSLEENSSAHANDESGAKISGRQSGRSQRNSIVGPTQLLVNGENNKAGATSEQIEDSSAAGQNKKERHHQHFLLKKQDAIEKIKELKANPQYQAHPSSSYSKMTMKSVKLTPSMQSGYLSPEAERPELRRKQSMDEFNKLGYAPTTISCVDYWEKLVPLSLNLYDTRTELYRCINVLRASIPNVNDDVACCALAETNGNVEEAIEKLLEPIYSRELSYLCTILEVKQWIDQHFQDPVKLPLSTVSSPLTSPVRFPSISSPTQDVCTTGAVQSSSPKRTIFPPCSSPQRQPMIKKSSPTKTPSSLQAQSHLSQILNFHFIEHMQQQQRSNKDAVENPTDALNTCHTQKHNERFDVVHDFRKLNAVLLSSQQSFSNGDLTI